MDGVIVTVQGIEKKLSEVDSFFHDWPPIKLAK